METYFKDICSNRQINRFTGILKSKALRFNQSFKLIRQILLHWCYELTLS